MLAAILRSIFGCGHRNLSRVWTSERLVGMSESMKFKFHYQTCLDCGKELPYKGEWLQLQEETRTVKHG